MRMKKTKTLCLAVMAVLVIGFVTACSSSSDDLPEPDLKPGDKVTDFKPVAQYDKTKLFQSDLDAFVTYAISIHSFRVYWWAVLSKGFETGEPFCSDWEYINSVDGSIMSWYAYDVIDEVVENAEAYEQAMNNLQKSGILPDPTSKTRGWIADGLNFIYNCRNTQVMGRKSVMAVLQNSPMGTDTRKLKELYDMLPANLRSGYTKYEDFWHDFSKGRLDSKANQIFLNLYTYDHLDFGEKARILGITPGGNITAAGAKLIESGANLVIDASPFSTQIGYGKDLYGAINATSDLVTKGDVKGFLQMAASNANNYGPMIYNGLKFKVWEGYDLFDPNEWDLALAQEAFASIINDAIFSDTFYEAVNKGDGENLIPNLVTSIDENGKEVLLVCMVDESTGRITVGFSMDKDGNITMNPKTPGTKQVTVVGRNGKRKTTTIVVPKDEKTVLTVDLKDNETLLEERPKDGYIKMDRETIGDEGSGGYYKAMILTNYLYYSCKTEDDWISPSIATDVNQLNVRLSRNDTGKERSGKVTVCATDSKGEVLASTVLRVVQILPPPTEYWVSASPSTLAFDAKGGKLESVIDHSYAFNQIGLDYSDQLEGWAKISWKETASGWNIVVDASENMTGQERSGTITVYAAANKDALSDAINNGKIDPDLVASTTILVKQSAKEEQPAFNPDTNIKELRIRYEMYATQGDSYNRHVEDLKCGADEIKVTQGSNCLYFNVQKKDTKYGDEDRNTTLSFTIEYNSNGWGDLSDFKIETKYYYEKRNASWQYYLEIGHISGPPALTSGWWANGNDINVKSYIYKDEDGKEHGLYNDKSGNMVSVFFSY